MTAENRRIEERARRRFLKLNKRRRDERFQRTLGRFVAEGLLVLNYEVPKNRQPLVVKDVLWAGQSEPRLLELLPALIVKRPGLFAELAQLPPDLAEVVDELRNDRVPEAFRGIPGRDVHGWLRRVGRRGKAPSRLKFFRFTPADRRLLEELSKKLRVSETEVVRRGLRALS